MNVKPKPSRFRCWGHSFHRAGGKVDLTPLLTGAWASPDPYAYNRGEIRMYPVKVKLRHEGRDLAREFQTTAELKPDGRIVFKFDDLAYYVQRGDEFTIQPV